MKTMLSRIEGKVDPAKLEYRHYKRGELLSLSAERFYLLKKGRVSVEVSNRSFNAFKVIELHENELIAPLLSMENIQKLPVSILVREKAEIVSLPKRDFFATLSTNPEDLAEFFQLISTKSSLLFRKLLFLTMSIEDKFLNYLEEHKNEENVVALDRSMTELAKEFFITRPALYKGIRNLLEDGVIEKIDGKTFRIL